MYNHGYGSYMHRAPYWKKKKTASCLLGFVNDSLCDLWLLPNLIVPYFFIFEKGVSVLYLPTNWAIVKLYWITYVLKKVS